MTTEQSPERQRALALLSDLIGEAADEYEEEELRRLRLLLREAPLDLRLTYAPDDQWGQYHLAWREEPIGRFRTAQAVADFVDGFLWGYRCR